MNNQGGSQMPNQWQQQQQGQTPNQQQQGPVDQQQQRTMQLQKQPVAGQPGDQSGMAGNHGNQQQQQQQQQTPAPTPPVELPRPPDKSIPTVMMLQPKQNRVITMGKPQGLDPVEILQERENRYVWGALYLPVR